MDQGRPIHPLFCKGPHFFGHLGLNLTSALHTLFSTSYPPWTIVLFSSHSSPLDHSLLPFGIPSIYSSAHSFLHSFHIHLTITACPCLYGQGTSHPSQEPTSHGHPVDIPPHSPLRSHSAAIDTFPCQPLQPRKRTPTPAQSANHYQNNNNNNNNNSSSSRPLGAKCRQKLPP
ncbi:hypothetical protein BC939DRAFT_210893 [Gamsiella multidivaricata]|uniref:uncharacterized protein n=1 Tax=Gamsiella multidivaricata TaxID=101098 RepID=UPI00221FB15A|nr:uncharacterized protein BC939DRAFT_210893 [Gamsiella multidivaricata]KAI7821251.1 hypothetical protein BC939DRAFT_210893 [Gamsiella multidivaricata]